MHRCTPKARLQAVAACMNRIANDYHMYADKVFKGSIKQERSESRLAMFKRLAAFACRIIEAEQLERTFLRS